MGMMILLDTNSLLWVLEDNERLGPIARASLQSADSVYSSSISMVEIQIKSMLGKLPAIPNVRELARQSGLRELALSHADAEALADFPTLTRHDPFDRMLVAQAQVQGIRLMTSDRVLLGLGPSMTQDVRL